MNTGWKLEKKSMKMAEGIALKILGKKNLMEALTPGFPLGKLEKKITDRIPVVLLNPGSNLLATSKRNYRINP